MQHPALVCGLHAVADLGEQAQALLQGWAMRLEVPIERGPIDEFHDKEAAVVPCCAAVDDCDDIRVVDSGGVVDLALETHALFLGGQHAVQQDFDRDLPSGGDLRGGENDALPAAVDLVAEFIPRDLECPVLCRLFGARQLPHLLGERIELVQLVQSAFAGCARLHVRSKVIQRPLVAPLVCGFVGTETLEFTDREVATHVVSSSTPLYARRSSSTRLSTR